MFYSNLWLLFTSTGTLKCCFVVLHTYLLLEVDIRHSPGMLAFRNDNFDNRCFLHSATNSKSKKERCHSSNETWLEFCLPHSRVACQGCDTAWFFLPTCYLKTSSNSRPDHSSIVDQHHHGWNAHLKLLKTFIMLRIVKM